MRLLQPDGWKRPAGYSNGVAARGEVVFVAGQVAWDTDENIVSDDLVQQVGQALANVVAVLSAAGSKPEHVARMTWYVTDINEYQARKRDIGATYREIMGAHYPAMTLVEVSRLLEDGAMVEIEATAVIPPGKD